MAADVRCGPEIVHPTRASWNHGNGRSHVGRRRSCSGRAQSRGGCALDWQTDRHSGPRPSGRVVHRCRYVGRRGLLGSGLLWFSLVVTACPSSSAASYCIGLRRGCSPGRETLTTAKDGIRRYFHEGSGCEWPSFSPAGSRRTAVTVRALATVRRSGHRRLRRFPTNDPASVVLPSGEERIASGSLSRRARSSAVSGPTARPSPSRLLRGRRRQ